MFRKSPLGRSRSLATSSRSAKYLKYTRPALEPLEDRKLLTASSLINEIYIDPPGGGDSAWEYVELRGEPGASLDGNYLIFVENENDVFNTGETGLIDLVFDLNGKSFGSNGFLTVRRAGNPYVVAPGTTDFSTSSPIIENSGFTAMLITSPLGIAPVAGVDDLDVGNDGLDHPDGKAGWAILDSIGIHAEAGESEYGRLYSPVGFGMDGTPVPGYVVVGYEIEYVGRYGNSTGHTAADWHVSNLTDNPLSGYSGTGDFRQSGEPHGAPSFVETNQGVPYGANLTKTLGAPNYPFGPALDLNGLALDTGYASTWNNTGAIAIADAVAATVHQGDGANLVSVTATITAGANPNNVLSANTAGTPISQSYNAGAGVLTLSGSATRAEYQQVLRTVKYNNSGGGPGAGSVTVNFVGNDTVTPSAAVTATISIDLPLNTTVLSRLLFYNQSGGGATRYDGNNLAINASDDQAIATDKTAYLWEDAGPATFANVSSYTKGINGIMIDLQGAHGTISTDDFIFRVGNNNSPGTWATIGATSVSVRAGAGLSGSDRVTIIWNTGAATKQWLEVIMLANADTGLAQKAGHPVGHGDAFFFGNALGNTGAGDSLANSLVNSVDEAGIRANNALVGANIPITNIYDVGRNASVNATDESAARLNGTNPTTTLKYLNLNTAPAAPEADGGDEISPLVADNSDAAAGLAAPAAASEEVKVPGWIKNRLDSIDLNSGNPARLFQHLHDVNTPGSRKLLQKFDAVADSLGLDDELLDALLADLK